MEASLKNGLHLCCSYDFGIERNERGVGNGSVHVLGWKSEFKGRRVVAREHSGSYDLNIKAHPLSSSIHAQSSICVPRYLRWWEKSITSNMIEIESADQLVHSLLNAGDKLVILDFYSPGCGGCKALHPKICQIAESNPNTLFLKVNYDEHKSMCNSLNIRVLPFFRFYRGTDGRVCSFSCTNATIKKFKISMAKHGAERCSLGPARGLEESELHSLASNKDIKFTYPLGYVRTMDLAVATMVGSSIADSLLGDTN